MLGAFYGLDLLQVNYDSHYDVIAPVPLHYSRKRQRGYNQSMEFAKGLSESLKIPVEDLLKRVRKTGTQTRRTKLNRWENVNKVFEVTGQPAGKRVLLVDDIITTGATVEACAIKLLDAGCQHVGIVCIAATQ